MKKILAMVLSLALVATMAITGSIAYLQDSDEAVNVMTLGNVDIEQIELERVVQENNPDAELKKFTQNKPLYPAVGEFTWPAENQKWPDVSATASSPLFDADKLNNVIDKFVFVENTGKSDAYVRTLFAFEIGGFEPSIVINDDLIHLNANDKNTSETGAGHWAWTWMDKAVEINGNNYAVAEAIYLHKSSVQGTSEEGILPKGATSYPSLLQVFMDSKGTNEDCEKIDGNKNGLYDIMVVSQAVQVMGFEEKGAKGALDTAFGAPADLTADTTDDAKLTNVQAWFGNIKTFNETNTQEEILDILTSGGTVVAPSHQEYLIESDEEITFDGNGTNVILSGKGSIPGESYDYGYLGFIPAKGEDATVEDLYVTGSGFVEVGHHDEGGGTYDIKGLVIEDLIATLAINNGGNNIAAAFSHYGNATMTDCTMTGTTTAKEGYTPYDAAFVNGTKTTISGGEYGNVYLANQAHVTITNAKVDTIYSCAITTRNLGMLTIGAGAEIGTITLNPGKYTPALTIEDGASVDQIIYNGTTYTQADWLAR